MSRLSTTAANQVCDVLALDIKNWRCKSLPVEPSIP